MSFQHNLSNSKNIALDCNKTLAKIVLDDKKITREFVTVIGRFDKMRRKRNIFTYDVTISISKTEANNALNTAAEFVIIIENVIKNEHPQTQFKF